MLAATPHLLSASRFVSAARIVVVLSALLLVPGLSRRHGGRIRASAGEFLGAIPGLRTRLFR